MPLFFGIGISLNCSMLHWYADDLFIFFRKRGRTLRASLLSRSRVTLTPGLRRRRRRRRTAARTLVICATRSSRRAALCLDTNTNTQVNTHATSHKAFPRLRLNQHATRNHSSRWWKHESEFEQQKRKWGIFLRNSAEQGGHLHSNRYYSTGTEED